MVQEGARNNKILLLCSNSERLETMRDGNGGAGRLKEQRGNNSETMENKPGGGMGTDQAGVRTEVHAVGVQREGYK